MGVLRRWAISVMAALVIAIAALSLARTSASDTLPGQRFLAPSAAPDPILAVHSSDSFVDSWGFNTHFNYRNTPYQDAQAQELQSLRAIGVRHIRDGLPNAKPNQLQIYDDLCRDGIHHSVAFNVDTPTSKMAATIDRFGPSCIDFVEPQNEYDGPRHPDWPTEIFDEQTTLYHLIKSTPAYSNIVVLGPALSSIARYGLLQNLDNVEDAANLHDATCDGNPGTRAYNSLAKHIGRIRQATKIRPIWVTEAAYSDATLDSGLPQASHCGLPDSVIARYAPRSQAERFNLGEQRIYWYEFSDQPLDRKFGAEGFVDRNGLPKQQYVAVQSLLKLLADPGHSLTPRQPMLSVSSSSAAVHTLLLEKHDGSYYLLLWQEVPSWDVKEHVVLSPAPVDVRLSMSPTVSSADYYQYDAGWRFVQKPVQVRNGTVSLPVTDSVSILRFTPAG